MIYYKIVYTTNSYRYINLIEPEYFWKNYIGIVKGDSCIIETISLIKENTESYRYDNQYNCWYKRC